MGAVLIMGDHLKTGLIGAGVFASYHASKIESSDTATFSGIYDPDHDRAGALADKHATVSLDSLDGLLEHSDAVIIAAPASYHFELGNKALEADCHVLMEKPLALTGASARELTNLADKKQLILQVGHQERLVCQALGLFGIGEVPRSVEIVRAGPPPQKGRTMDISVIWDLMIHDIDLMHALISGDLLEVKCTGRAELG